jgi:thiol-disulfide isomerase/thioredoxin
MGTVPPMKKALFRLSAALALAAFLPVSASPVAPAPAPAWKLRDVDGNVVSSDQFKGKVVVLDFWATWCPPCRTEIPGYVQLQKKYAADGLVIVGVSVDTDGPQVVKKFMKDFGINYPIVMADDEIQNTFAPIQGYPTTFIIDREGRIRNKKLGREPTAEFEKQLLAILKPPPA